MATPIATDLSLEERGRIRTEVGKLIQHEGFRASTRNKRFLEFVVDETLCGRSERIKAYTIAVDVFGRGAEFNPSVDPIVRIEATRLRLALATFYAGPGAEAPIRVMMAKGKYIPTFVATAQNGHVGLRSKMEGPDRICALVEVTWVAGMRPNDAIHLACDLTIESLKQSNVQVLYAPAEGRFAARKAFDDFLKEPGSAFAVDLLSSGTGIFWRISNLASDVILCRERLDLLPGTPPLVEAIREITRRVAFLVASPATVDHWRPHRS
jgi:hypothetical protein